MMANVPNYQGMFLRGYGSQAHVQNNGSTIGNTSTTHSSGALGATQGDAARRSFGASSVMHVQYLGDISGWRRQDGAVTSESTTVSTRSAFNGSVDAVSNRCAFFRFDNSLIIPTASENRPVNKAVKYLVRTR